MKYLVGLLLLCSVEQATALTPYNLDFRGIEKCEIQFVADENAEFAGFGSWLRGDDLVSVVIQAKNHRGRTIQTFGDENGDSFEDKAAAEYALSNLREQGICP